jgi:hypothetical protein
MRLTIYASAREGTVRLKPISTLEALREFIADVVAGVRDPRPPGAGGAAGGAAFTK